MNSNYCSLLDPLSHLDTEEHELLKDVARRKQYVQTLGMSTIGTIVVPVNAGKKPKVRCEARKHFWLVGFVTLEVALVASYMGCCIGE